MQALRRERLLTHEDFFAREDGSEGPLEFIAGQAFPLESPSFAHAAIVANLIVGLGCAVSDCGCHIMCCGMKIYVEAADAFYCTDVAISCADQQKGARTLCAPEVVIEVVSPGTESIDRREKLTNYRRAPSIAEIVLVNQDWPHIEIHRRDGDGWEIEILETEGTLQLRSLNAAMEMADIYRIE